MRELTIARPPMIASFIRPAATLGDTRLAAINTLSAEERAALDGAGLSSRSMKVGEELVREAEPTGSLHFLADGWACRFKITRDGRRQISTLLAPGDVCNLDALFLGRLAYGVRMLTPGTVLSLPRERAAALAADHAGIASAFASLAFLENAILAQWVLCLGRHSALERVAHLICELSVRLGHSSDEGEVSFEFPLTQEQIADVAGLTAVHVNRTLQRLRSDGLLASRFRRIVVRDIAALRRIADFRAAYLDIGYARPAAN